MYFLGDELGDSSPVKSRLRPLFLFLLCMLGNNVAITDGALEAEGVVASVVFGGVEGVGLGAKEGVGAFVSSSSLL